jgi:ribose transport system ATP-binding protein
MQQSAQDSATGVAQSGNGLELRHIVKSFPGVRAVRDVTFACRNGEIHALLGGNGAGKSTLMAVATGDLAPDQGEVIINGQPLTTAHPRFARELGLAMVFQDQSLIPDLDVVQNLLLGAGTMDALGGQGLEAWATELLRDFEMPIAPRTMVRDLPLAARQVVEIVKALVARPKVLILDEPTAALTRNEVFHLHSILRRVVADGVAVVYITHRLPEVFALANRVSVMRDGAMVAFDVEVSSLDEDALVHLMAGRTFEQLAHKTTAAPKRDADSLPVLQVRGLSSEAFSDVSMEVWPGEIIGIGGIEGNGQRDFLRSLAGINSAEGTILVKGTPVTNGSVRRARDAGIRFVSSDRRRESLFLGLAVRANMTIGSLPDLSRFGIINQRVERAAAVNIAERLNIKTPGLEAPVSVLSGGNQQKVALGRAVMSGPTVYLIDEPTQGVDAGARAQLYELLRQAAAEGAAVIVLSSDGEELCRLCDRVLVFGSGRITRELKGETLTEENIVAGSARAEVGRVARSGENTEGLRGPSTIRRIRSSDYSPVVLLLAAIVALGAVLTSQSPYFLVSSNLSNLLFLAVPLGFAALGQASAMLIGEVDLSIGPVIALTTVAMAMVMYDGGGVGNDILAVVVAVAIGMAVGILNGLLVDRVRLIPFIATLATFILIQGVALQWLPFPGGFVANDLQSFAQGSFGPVPWAFAALCIITVGVELLYRRSRFGLLFRAVGSKPSAARRLGVPSRIIHYGVYLFAATMAAIAGIFFTATIGVGDPALGVPFTLASFSAVVVGGLSTWGGRGSLVGPLLGALFFAMLQNGSALLNLPAHITFFAQGGLSLLTIALYSRLRAEGANVDESITR